MKPKNKLYRNGNIVILSLSCIVTTNPPLASDLDSSFEQHARYCEDQIEKEENKLFGWFVDTEISLKCAAYASDKIREDLDQLYIEKGITDRRYRAASLRMEASRLERNANSPTPSSYEGTDRKRKETIQSGKEKRSGLNNFFQNRNRPIKTVDGYTTIGPAK